MTSPATTERTGKGTGAVGRPPLVPIRELLRKVDVPEGTSGEWAVERFTISKKDAEWYNMRSLFASGPNRPVSPGTYTRLTRLGDVVMSDTPAELADHRGPIRMAHGHCLVNGLGLGVVVRALLDHPDVARVTVVEIDPDVMALVAPHYQARYGDRLEIVRANALTYVPSKGARFGVVWHDIWPTICADNLDEMKLLHRRYGRRCDWQGSWGRDLLRDLR